MKGRWRKIRLSCSSRRSGKQRGGGVPGCSRRVGVMMMIMVAVCLCCCVVLDAPCKVG